VRTSNTVQTSLDDDAVVIAQRGRPIAVLVSVERWNALQERLEDLEDEVAILEHRTNGELGASAESVSSAIEAGGRAEERPGPYGGQTEAS
jgi:prevent-host-death family protein